MGAKFRGGMVDFLGWKLGFLIKILEFFNALS